MKKGRRFGKRAVALLAGILTLFGSGGIVDFSSESIPEGIRNSLSADGNDNFEKEIFRWVQVASARHFRVEEGNGHDKKPVIFRTGYSAF